MRPAKLMRWCRWRKFQIMYILKSKSKRNGRALHVPRYYNARPPKKNYGNPYRVGITVPSSQRRSHLIAACQLGGSVSARWLLYLPAYQSIGQLPNITSCSPHFPHSSKTLSRFPRGVQAVTFTKSQQTPPMPLHPPPSTPHPRVPIPTTTQR